MEEGSPQRRSRARRALIAGSLVLLAWFALAAAGSTRSPATAAAPPAARALDAGRAGRLESAAFLNRIAAADIAQAIATAGHRAPAAEPRYDVINHRLTYRTIDGRGQPIIASGLVSVPAKRQGARSPVMAYQHGTLFKDAQAPSNHAVAHEAAVVMASLGYIVVAADYVGYGVSAGAPHPYLMAEPSAAAVLDLLTAAQTWRREAGIADNGQLFLTGYSQGGYVTLAAHRAMQAGNSPHLQQLVATVAGAGPYHVGVTVSEQLQRLRDRYPLIGSLVDPEVLDLLSRSLRREVRRAVARQLVPADADVKLQMGFLDRHFDGDHEAMERLSNVHDWKPEAPVSLFHGRDDRTVPLASATRTLQAMRSRGAARVSLTSCPAVPSSHRNCVAPYWNFMLGQLAALARDR